MSSEEQPTARRIRRALISVYDKTGVVEFAKSLHEEFGIELISTGGTARVLREAGLSVTLVEEITGFPEMMDGRVKTLHPKIHAAILADRDNPEHMRQLAEQGIEPIDMVVVNLYPFEQTIAKPDCTFEEAIEMIDIGGPCLLRAAAKNHKHVLVVSDPEAYCLVLGELRHWDNQQTRAHALLSGGREAFWKTQSYDTSVFTWLGAELGADWHDGPPASFLLRLFKQCSLRYGENPHQHGEHLTVYDDPEWYAVGVQVDQAETELSFNNYADASAALVLCADLTRSMEKRPSGPPNLAGLPPVICFIKHTNACGVAVGDDPIEVYRKAYLGDPNAAMGGILAVNFNVDTNFATAVMETYQRWGKEAGAGGFFVEVWLAPSFDEDAVQSIHTLKPWGRRVRLLDVGNYMDMEPDPKVMDFKRIAGGVLMQTRDLVGLNEDQWQVVTKRKPTDDEMADLRLAWLVCKHTKSNAITVCRDGMLLGNGAGQMSRVMSCRIATWLAKENGHEDRLSGAVAASDAFFPFRDGPDILADAGITALIQPGGSKRDQEVIDAANERGLAMILTGTRHFRH